MSCNTKKMYAEKPTWNEKFRDGKVRLSKYACDESWYELFKKLFDNPKMQKLLEKLSGELSNATTELLMYPKPDYVFSCFVKTKFDDVVVVFLGQDPYFNYENYGDRFVPQATGLSFSVMNGFAVPSSLSNIYANLVKYGHLEKSPNHGCLDFWAYQGCLMLNTALTVIDNAKKCHSPNWSWFTDEVIKYVSENKDYVVFVLWGSDAYNKVNLIDLDKHDIVVSSHPSGLSADKPMKEYPAFNKFDHFGEINKLLKKKGKHQIMWQL